MGKKELLLSELKARYKQLYEAIQPIPCNKERLYCVDQVFVEGGIEYLAESWLPLGSYHLVFGEPHIKSKRRVLIGDPGFGKTTLTLQYAYDWCNGVQESYLKDVEILILLRLRQLGGVTSIYTAIKRSILSSRSQLTEHDIEGIMQSTSSVVVMLDGFDEYPDKDKNPKTDIMKIVHLEMFQQFEVILTSRHCPENLPPNTTQLQLVGFDDRARDKYIRKILKGNDVEAVDRIKRRLQENPILGDLCQVPLIFVMFAHMSHENKDLETLKTVTSFFQYMIQYFHSHVINKAEDENVEKYRMLEEHHMELDRVAFEGLNKGNKEIVWKSHELIGVLGKYVYNHYIHIGILVEDDIIDDDDPYQKDVRFCHQVFCEWYAAHFLAKCFIGSSDSRQMKEALRYMNPLDLQFCYQFACGLNRDAAGRIIEYVKRSQGGDKLAVLCLLEQEDRVEGMLNIVKDLCQLKLNDGDSKLLQKSSVRLMEIASNHNVPISYLSLHNCYSSVDLCGGNRLCLKSGFSIPVLNTLRHLSITHEGRDITAEDFAGIISYASRCQQLVVLWFMECLLPQSVQPECTSVPGLRNASVTWSPQTGYQRYQLNLRSGLWQHTYKSLSGQSAIKIMTDDDYQRVITKFRQKWERSLLA